ncbi:MAG: filamentous hemagglutinin N-terminal domain-containing protein [Cyanobacteria bacterium P01_G01_bin.54]
MKSHLIAGFTFTALLATSPLAAQAQIVPDGTLGAESSVINGQRIEGGAIRRSNLFHSFLEFGIPAGAAAYFANPAGITDIFGRVTGGNPSEIFGTLGVDGAANLTLLNPNGILFGPDAQLDIRGSFTATTAESVSFGNGFAFSAINPTAPPLLTIGVPLGLQRGTNPGNIESLARLEVGGDLILDAGDLILSNQVLAGGDLTLKAEKTVEVRDSVAQPAILAARGELLVQGNDLVDIFVLNHPESGLFSGGDMVLRSDNPIIGDAHYWSGGSFEVNQNLMSPNDPIILAEGDVTIGDYTGASLHILAGGSITTGDIEINNTDTTNNSINPNNSSPFLAGLAQFTTSDGKNVTVDGSDTYTIDLRAGIDWNQLGGFPGNTILGTISPSPTLSSPATSADITTGKLDTYAISSFDGGQIIVTNQFVPNSLLGSISNGTIDARDFTSGGQIIIDAKDSLDLNGTVTASSVDQNLGFGLQVDYTGNGGEIHIVSQGTITTNSEIIASGLVGGSISINTQSALNLNYRLESESYAMADSSKGGTVSINTNGQDLWLQNGSAIFTTAYGSAQAGDIEIQAGDITFSDVENSTEDVGLFATTQGTGDAGKITISGQDVTLDRASVFANTFRNDDDPDLPIPNTPPFSPAGILGDANSITINSRTLTLNNGAILSTASQSEGNGGTIAVNASESVTLNGTNENGLPSAFIFGAFDSGNAGQLEVNTRKLIIQDGGLVSGTAYADDSGRAGELIVNANDMVSILGSGSNAPSGLVYETAGSGNAGNFNLTTGTLNIKNGGNLSAQSIGSGSAGTLTVTANEINVEGRSADGQYQSRIFFESSTTSDAGGIGFNVAGDVNVKDGGLISVSGNGSGRAGDLNINARNIVLENQSNILAFTQSGEGGNIRLNVAQDIRLRNNSNILTEARGSGNGGNIFLNAPNGFILAVLSENSDIAATAIQGNGGNIFVSALGTFVFSNPGRLVRTSQSDLSANSIFGTDGTVTLQIEDFEPELKLPSDLLDPNINTACSAYRERQDDNKHSPSQFFITHQGGLSPSPENITSSSNIELPWLDIESNESTVDGVLVLFDDEVAEYEVAQLQCYPFLTVN